MSIDLLRGDEWSQWGAILIIAAVLLMLTTVAMLATDEAWWWRVELPDELAPEQERFDDI